ncbi:MSHA biogenesis protein MshN [Marinobacter salsuginis]|uniref:tetratricopeptide repeat protein n=1 Tax=Marinobacter salsuginis TaxID=418719 RepID=UPI001C95E9F5|nr:MSHA biogenesis protein MshN [Marinobacter salsuginis]MBY6073241.1 MSHA biogenesis protein MshN [Marinobacter salsuginis]
MSLLNDALRAAEQRQNRPEVAAAYAGQSQSRPRPRYGFWVVIVFLVAGAVGASAFWLMTGTGNEDIPVHVSAPPAQEAGTELQLESVAENDNTEEASQPAPEPPVVVQSEPEAREVAKAVEPQKPEPEPEPVRAEAPEPESAVTTPVVAEAETAQESEAPTPPIKQVRETPEAIDRRVSRELASLLRSGETRQAEEMLQELANVQAATASREVFARQMLVQEMPDRALAWLPESVTSGDAGLRLLRARALHAKGSLPEALATLESSVPAVRQAVEYRVTLATLLQQAGRTTDAARHWSALIAEDDSRAAWWVGLAIALETGGEINSAVRAYSQAAQLPGLSPSLANYVRERLKALQAG